MSVTGKNITPPDMKVEFRRPLNDLCDRALCDVVMLLKPKIIVGVGKYAQERAQTALQSANIGGIQIEAIMHPSPANPTANKGWNPIVQKQLEDMGVMKYLTN